MADIVAHCCHISPAVLQWLRRHHQRDPEQDTADGQDGKRSHAGAVPSAGMEAAALSHVTCLRVAHLLSRLSQAPVLSALWWAPAAVHTSETQWIHPPAIPSCSAGNVLAALSLLESLNGRSCAEERHGSIAHTHIHSSHTHTQLIHTHTQLTHTHTQLTHTHIHSSHTHTQLTHT